MAIRQIVVSDIGGEELKDGKVAKLRVSGHPVLGSRQVELDVGIDEARQFEDSASEFVYLEVDVPGDAPKEVVLDVQAFEKAFGNADVQEVLEHAREGTKPEPQTRRRRQRSTASSSAPAQKRDYTDIENIGLEHRGRVTEKEAEMVRENLDRANVNRAREGQAPIDPADAKMKKRYGF